jgi:hypothetical protein
MRTEESSISLTVIETELLLAALTHYEQKFQKERSETLADDIRVLRGKLLGKS